MLATDELKALNTDIEDLAGLLEIRQAVMLWKIQQAYRNMDSATQKFGNIASFYI